MHTNTLIDIGRTWLGVPFRHQGRSRLGVDCGGYLECIAIDAGLNITRSKTYSRSPDPQLIEEALLANCIKVPISDMQPGDILWFSFAGEPRHVGLATDIGVLHAWAKPGKVVEHRLDEVWLKRLKAVYRIKEDL